MPNTDYTSQNKSHKDDFRPCFNKTNKIIQQNSIESSKIAALVFSKHLWWGEKMNQQTCNAVRCRTNSPRCRHKTNIYKHKHTHFYLHQISSCSLVSVGESMKNVCFYQFAPYLMFDVLNRMSNGVWARTRARAQLSTEYEWAPNESTILPYF